MTENVHCWNSTELIYNNDNNDGVDDREMSIIETTELSISWTDP